jgi:hypothetical protein
MDGVFLGGVLREGSEGERWCQGRYGCMSRFMLGVSTSWAFEVFGGEGGGCWPGLHGFLRSQSELQNKR